MSEAQKTIASSGRRTDVKHSVPEGHPDSMEVVRQGILRERWWKCDDDEYNDDDNSDDVNDDVYDDDYDEISDDNLYCR